MYCQHGGLLHNSDDGDHTHVDVCVLVLVTTSKTEKGASLWWGE